MHQILLHEEQFESSRDYHWHAVRVICYSIKCMINSALASIVHHWDKFTPHRCLFLACFSYCQTTLTIHVCSCVCWLIYCIHVACSTPAQYVHMQCMCIEQQLHSPLRSTWLASLALRDINLHTNSTNSSFLAKYLYISLTASLLSRSRLVHVPELWAWNHKKWYMQVHTCMHVRQMAGHIIHVPMLLTAWQAFTSVV